jgi:tRNA dimethylallyltransferase
MSVRTIQIVCGPTASGKSARAIEIAQAQGGVIINADAMQVYRELRIITARPTAEEEAQAPHRLYGILPAAKACSAARWLTLAAEAIEAVWKEGKLPVVTGGTGLYLKTLMEGLSAIPDVPQSVREQAAALWASNGAAALRLRDPLMEARLKPNDRQRHIRALEVFLATGKSLAYWQLLERKRPYGDVAFKADYVDVPREELYRRCDARFLTMMKAGALEEVRAFAALKLSPDLPAMHAVGVPELMGYLKGQWSLGEAVAKAQQATRNYAKRQVTWFKHQLKSV